MFLGAVFLAPAYASADMPQPVVGSNSVASTTPGAYCVTIWIVSLHSGNKPICFASNAGISFGDGREEEAGETVTYDPNLAGAPAPVVEDSAPVVVPDATTTDASDTPVVVAPDASSIDASTTLATQAQINAIEAEIQSIVAQIAVLMAQMHPQN